MTASTINRPSAPSGSPRRSFSGVTTTKRKFKPFDIIISHASCADGLVAAWAARKHSPLAEIVFARHGDAPPDCSGKRVLVVDFSYDRATCDRMNDEAEFMTILDHHKRAKELLGDAPYAVFDMHRSGCGMAWDILIGGDRPRLVDYTEDRDIWTFKHPDTKAFCAGFFAGPQTFEACDRLSIEDNVDDVVTAGAAILQYSHSLARRLAYQAIPVDIGGDLFWGLNAPGILISDVAEILCREDLGYLPVVFWQRKPDATLYSLRSSAKGIDVSDVAGAHGGGGHRNAAGFASSTDLVCFDLSSKQRDCIDGLSTPHDVFGGV